MAVTQQSGHWGKRIDEKNRKSKISCPCTFKWGQVFQRTDHRRQVFHSTNLLLKPGIFKYRLTKGLQYKDFVETSIIEVDYLESSTYHLLSTIDRHSLKTGTQSNIQSTH